MMDRVEVSNLNDRQRIRIMMPLWLGGFIALMNETLLNVAFPQLMSDLHVSTSTVQWLATAYMLVVGVLVPVVAFLLKTFTTRTLYVTAMILFSVGTAACGFSQSFPILLAFRMMQAAGTALLLPIMIDTVLEIYPPARRGTALGISMMAVVFAPGIGPTLSGIVVHYLDWHWLFFLVLPFALLATILGATTLRNVATLTKPKIDLLSVALSSTGFGGLTIGICSIENMGIWNVTVLVSLLCGIGGVMLFARRQLALKQPMLELRAFGYPQFALGAVLIFIAFTMTFALNIILPVYAQSALGITPIAAGLLLLPGSILNGLASPLSGRLYDRFGARPLALSGFSALVATMYFLSHVSASTTLAMLIILQVSMMVGIVLIFAPMQANAMNQLPHEYNAHGVAILSTGQQIAAAFGSSLFIGLMGAVEARQLAQLVNPDAVQRQRAIISGVDMAFTAALIMAGVGLTLSFFVKRHERESMVFDPLSEQTDEGLPIAPSS